jgi:fructokinase
MNDIGLPTRAEEVRIEIETLGAGGVRYVARNGDVSSDWRFIPAFPGLPVSDTAGAGDWFTASLIDSLGRGGLTAFSSIGHEELACAMRRGQAVAAWSCQFEGARGGMYYATREEMEESVDKLLAGGSANGRSHVGRTQYGTHGAMSKVCAECQVGVLG